MKILWWKIKRRTDRVSRTLFRRLLSLGEAEKQLVRLAMKKSFSRILVPECRFAPLAIRVAKMQAKARVTAMDPSPEDLTIASLKAFEAGVDIEFVRSAISDNRIERGCFDLIAVGPDERGLTCISGDDVLAMRELLRPGGEIILGFFGFSRPIRAIVSAFPGCSQKGGRNRFHLQRADLEGLFAEAGLDPLEEALSFHLPFGAFHIYHGPVCWPEKQ